VSLTRNILATLGALLIAVLFVGARLVGLLSHQLLGATLAVGVLWAVGSRIVQLARARSNWAFARSPLSREHRGLLKHALCRGWTWLVVAVTCVVIFPRSEEMFWIIVVIAAGGLVRVAAELLPSPPQSVGFSVVFALTGTLLGVDFARAVWPPPPPDVVLERPPFTGEWLVLQAGPVPLISHHSVAYNQVYAVDFVRLVDGKLLSSEVPTREAWNSWEQPLVAPSAGLVVVASDGMEDGRLFNMQTKKENALGNHVVIDIGGRYAVFAHLRNGTVSVREGQRVEAGHAIGDVGNSGNTTGPHLHFQVQTHVDLWDPDNRSVSFAFGDGGHVLRRNDLVHGP